MRLIVMRHAKSAWDTSAASDHARPLSSRGRRDAPRVGARLAELGWVPEQVLSSDSVRTRETWQGLSEHLDCPVKFSRSLYHAGLGDVQGALTGLKVQTAMVLFHNPGCEWVVSFLTGDGARITTANAALLEHDGTDWAEAITDAGGWRLVKVLRPKQLAGD